MKKIGLVLALSAMLFIPAMAQNVEVEALSDFTTDNPPKVFSVKLVQSVGTDKGVIERGSIIEGKITAKDAKRLKRDATFSFVPTTLTEPNGNVIRVKRNYIGKYSKGLDKGQIAKTAALSAGNFVVKGFSTGFTAIEGAVKNEQGNVLKSSAVAVYESSPLSYVEKGDALVIKEGEHFYINFKLKDDDED